MTCDPADDDLLREPAPHVFGTPVRPFTAALIQAAGRQLTARCRRERVAAAGERLPGHRLDATRAHLLETAGDRTAAASRTTSIPGRRAGDQSP